VALEDRLFFISLTSGAVISAHDFDIFSPKPDGLVRDNAFVLNKNPLRRMTVQFVNTP